MEEMPLMSETNRDVINRWNAFGEVTTDLDCVNKLMDFDLPVRKLGAGGKLWCNYTWDSVLCWPAVPAGLNWTWRCPPSVKGSNPEKFVIKTCHKEGYWPDKLGFNSTTRGITDYSSCFNEELNNRKNFLEKVQKVAQTAHTIEYVGLWTTLVALSVAIIFLAVLLVLRRLRYSTSCYVKLCRIQVLICLLLVAAMFFYYQHQRLGEIVPDFCWLIFLFAEYFRTVAVSWALFECIYLAWSLFSASYQPGCLAIIAVIALAWLVPYLPMAVWFFIIMRQRKFDINLIEPCLGPFQQDKLFWIIIAFRFAGLYVAAVLVISNFIRILHRFIRSKQKPILIGRPKYADCIIVNIVSIAAVIILALQNCFYVFHYSPKGNDLSDYEAYIHSSSFINAFSGFVIALLYCLLDLDVLHALQSCCCRRSSRQSHEQLSDIIAYSNPPDARPLIGGHSAYEKLSV